MNEREKNEVDRLLRVVAREARNLSPAPGAHLDPDELSSYAENVLPAATRARYSAHLADCDDCRKLVIHLSQTAGPVTQKESEKRQPVRNYLRAFFSPVVLRYAVPALALIVVMGIGLLVYRRDKRDEFVAQQHSPVSNQPAATPAEIQPTPLNVANPAVHETAEANNARQNSDRTKSTEATDVEKPRSEATSAPVNQVRANEEQRAGGSGAVANAQPSYAPEPEAQSAPPPPVERMERGVAAERDEASARRDANKPQDSARTTQEIHTLGAGRVATGAQKKEALAKQKEAKVAATEVTSVAGRTFRRENNIWTDTAYEAGRATVIVKRDSEQYRALIADEPQLRTVAESLNGTVIVVWKGRAYKFK